VPPVAGRGPAVVTPPLDADARLRERNETGGGWVGEAVGKGVD
jgi:hypothetical protein